LLEQKVADLKVQIEDALTEEEIKNRNDQIKELKKKNQNDADFEMKFNYRRDLKSKESLEDELKTTEPKLERARLKRSCIQVAISEIRTPEQDFKMTMSSIFALLIGLVIFGFFGLAFKDDIIRRAIFSGETGIQFLTLFSIVIAIILFGITSILEGKELAALLGGLSGYILGRYSSSTSNQSPS
jgi:hypothetical protein